MKPTITLLCFMLPGLWLSAQNEYQVKYDLDAVGNVNFSADNYSTFPVYVALDFSYLENASFSEKLPFIKRVNPGTNSLFTIYCETDMPGPDFNIEIKWFISDPSPEVDPEYPYLIPVSSGSEVLVTSEIEKENNRSIGFELIGSDEVVASRKGIVIRLINNNHPNLPTEKGKQFNLVQLLHEDGTIGEYYNFAYHQINCKLGQTVLPGQIIGKANRIENNNYMVGFSLFHSDLNSKNKIFLIPEFLLEGSKISQVEMGKVYKSVQDEKIIIKELSGKEKREYKKQL
ncbi:MAG: hypothetical protein JXR31_10250 [Prolixibacteraceae bacterium]|nr:hypothetical protein [Prolixibacteraceae bacterium]MBN2774619.1 hypothetical protein [Prolixibacteraceae bacterium]